MVKMRDGIVKNYNLAKKGTNQVARDQTVSAANKDY